MSGAAEQIRWGMEYITRKYAASSDATTLLGSQELLDALSLRGVIPPCPCGQLVAFMPTFVGGDIYTLGCPGCNKRLRKCRCDPGLARWWERLVRRRSR